MRDNFIFKLRDIKFLNILNFKEIDIREGRITSIIGKSGSGKSTFLKLLNKIISPDSGTVYYRDEDIKDMDSQKLRSRVTMLSQTAVIFKGSIRDNLSIGRVFQNIQLPSEEEIRLSLKDVSLDKEPDSLPDNLSGGEKQRLCLARVMLMDSDVYLLDEPSSALDSETEKIIFEKITEHVRRYNKTLILVTHSWEEAFNISDEVIKIEDGKAVKIKEAE